MNGVSVSNLLEGVPNEEYDRVLSPLAVESLQANFLLSPNYDNVASWKIEPLEFYNYLPYLKFHRGHIPAYFNHPSIIVYLGFSQPAGMEVFLNLYTQGLRPPTRSQIMAALHAHIDGIWAGRTYTWLDTGTLVGLMVLNEFGLSLDAKSELNTLYMEFGRNAGIMQEYIDNHPGKTAESLELVDFIHELVNLRMKKLEKLNEVVLQWSARSV